MAFSNSTVPAFTVVEANYLINHKPYMRWRRDVSTDTWQLLIGPDSSTLCISFLKTDGRKYVGVYHNALASPNTVGCQIKAVIATILTWRDQLQRMNRISSYRTKSLFPMGKYGPFCDLARRERNTQKLMERANTLEARRKLRRVFNQLVRQTSPDSYACNANHLRTRWVISEQPWSQNEGLWQILSVRT